MANRDYNKSFYIRFISRKKSLLLGMKNVFEYRDLQMFGVKLNKYEQFPLTWSRGKR